MAKKANMAFLEYVLKYQNPNDNYFNRFFLLKNRMEGELSFSGKQVEMARLELEKAGLIGNTGSGRVYITDKGKLFYHENNQIKLKTRLERFTDHFNKKWVAILSIATLAVALYGLFSNKSDSSIIAVTQSIVVKIKSAATSQQVVFLD